MRTHVAKRPRSSTIYFVCGIFASFSISPHGGLCSMTCSPSPVAPVQELVHRSTVVFEGKLQELGRARDINQREREKLRSQRARVKRNHTEVMAEGRQLDLPSKTATPNRTWVAVEPYQVRIKVNQVWDVKAGGLEKDSIVSILWDKGDKCVTLIKDTRYMFFMEPTNDTLVFNPVFPPVETRRTIRKDVSKVLCKDCAEPKMKAMKSLTVEEGRVATLKCEVGAGNPTPKIKLYDKEGVELTAEEAKLRDAKLKSKKRGKVLEYQIRKTSQSHAGPYLCEARNNLGKASTTGNLTLIQAAATSTTPAVKTSSHVTPCSDAHKNYCVNGGECFTLEVTPGSPKFLCRCLSGFTGNRCQATVPVRVMNPKQHLGIEFMEAEELYQKRVLTITGICIALLVVGIMCVVAYCKTKKQRKKFQDRLRQSIRSERNHMASSADNGAWPPAPSNPPPPPENVQLVNQYLSKNAMPAQHAVEKESETSFSTSQYTSSAPQRSTTVTRTASQCWTNGRSESVPSDTRSASVRSSASGSQRGRLHGTAGANGVKASAAPPRVCGDTPMDCCRDSPYSERYVSAMTTPTRPSPAHPAPPLSPVTPGSPPSEASAPLSSVATSVAVTPAADEERPLLFATPPRPRDRQKRNSAHYNHGLEAASPPASPLAAVRDDDYQITHEHELRQDGPGEAGGLTAAAATAAPPAASPHGLPTKLTGNSSNNNNGRQAKRTKASAGRRAADGDPGRSSSESETEDEQAGEDTPFLSLQNPMVLGLALSLEVAPSSSSSSSSSSSDSSRTNPALLLSPQDELQARLSSAIAHQDPIAV